MKYLIFTSLLFAFGHCCQLSAQQTNVWKGNFPGQENNWECPRNWSLGQAPNWNAHVVIPMQRQQNCTYPVIRSKNCDIYSLTVEHGARLEIASGAVLYVSGIGSFDTPVHCEGELVVNGKLETYSKEDTRFSQRD